MKSLFIFILSLLIVRTSFGQCTGSSCTYTAVNGGNYDLNGSTLCVTSNISSLGNVNFNGSNNAICIKAGVSFSGGQNFNPGNVTFNIYGTFNFSGNVNSNVIFNIYSGGTLNYSGASLTSGTINNSGTLIFSNTGEVDVQNTSVTINNNTGGVFTATAPSIVKFVNANFNNSGTTTFTNVENNEGDFVNNSGGSITFQNGTFQHGQLHNNGTLVVNCTNHTGNCNTGNPCLTMGNKGPNQFTNSGNFTVNGSACTDAQVILSNSGTITINGDLSLNNNSQIAQSGGGSTTVSGSTTVTSGSDLSGGTLCSNGVNGSVSATISCGSPPTISDITKSTCKGVSLSIPIAATAPTGASVTWSSLRLINGTDSVVATAATPMLTTTNGTYTMSYTSTSASVLYIPTTNFHGINTIQYKIAATSGSTTTYAASKNITVTVSPIPTKPTTTIIANP